VPMAHTLVQLEEAPSPDMEGTPPNAGISLNMKHPYMNMIQDYNSVVCKSNN
jgi:hypothetical protein